MDRIAPLALIIPGLALVACSEKPLTPQVAVGQYALASRNDTGLPQITMATLQCDVWLVGGALAVNSDGSFLSRLS